MRSAWAALAIVLACGGCGDDEHKGTVSHGPSARPTSGQASPKKTRLVYQPKSPVVTMRLAEIAKKRYPKAEIQIGGETVHLDVAADQVEQAKTALAGGRADLFIAAEAASDADAGTPELSVVTETVATVEGPRTVRHLEGAPEHRDALVKQAEAHAGKAKVLLGEVRRDGSKRLRTHLVEPDATVRGEYLARAEAEPHARGARLVLRFEGSGRNFIRWHSKQKAGFVLQVDGSVVGSVFPTDEVKNGSLAFILEGFSLEAAKALAASIDGVALSHQTELESEKPLPR